jgi:divalent metal cation (Fe/Co/Zn/Cd) transporter
MTLHYINATTGPPWLDTILALAITAAIYHVLVKLDGAKVPGWVGHGIDPNANTR